MAGWEKLRRLIRRVHAPSRLSLFIGGPLNTARASQWLSGHVSPLPCAVRGWMVVVGGAIAVGVVYFLTARLGLALLASPSDVAVFWPAAGVAAGILITLGRRVLPALVIGVVAALGSRGLTWRVGCSFAAALAAGAGIFLFWPT